MFVQLITTRRGTGNYQLAVVAGDEAIHVFDAKKKLSGQHKGKWSVIEYFWLIKEHGEVVFYFDTLKECKEYVNDFFINV